MRVSGGLRHPLVFKVSKSYSQLGDAFVEESEYFLKLFFPHVV